MFRLKNRSKRQRTGMAILAAVLAFFFLTAESCDESTDTGATDRERAARTKGVAGLIAGQPAHTMSYSPTRDTINFWIDTWGKPNKLSYVYLMNADGQITKYLILKGLPVSYCAAITSSYDKTSIDVGDATGQAIVPGPGVDGAYYSGGQCNTYYGRDATTNAYIEYTVGLGTSVLLYDQPLPGSKAGDAQPLTPTTLEDVKQ